MIWECNNFEYELNSNNFSFLVLNEFAKKKEKKRMRQSLKHTVIRLDATELESNNTFPCK